MPVFCYAAIDPDTGEKYLDEDGFPIIVDRIYKHQERPKEIEVDGFVFKLASHTPARLSRNWGSANFGVNGVFNKALQKTIHSDKEYEDELKKRNLRPATVNDFDRYEAEMVEKQKTSKKLEEDMKSYQKLIKQGVPPVQANKLIFEEQERKQLDQLQSARQQGKVNPALEALASKLDIKKFKVKK